MLSFLFWKSEIRLSLQREAREYSNYKITNSWHSVGKLMTKSFKLLQETRRAFSSVARYTHKYTSFLKQSSFQVLSFRHVIFTFNIHWITASETFWSWRKSVSSFWQPKLVFPVFNFPHAISSWRNKSIKVTILFYSLYYCYICSQTTNHTNLERRTLWALLEVPVLHNC